MVVGLVIILITYSKYIRHNNIILCTRPRPYARKIIVMSTTRMFDFSTLLSVYHIIQPNKFMQIRYRYVYTYIYRYILYTYSYLHTHTHITFIKHWHNIQCVYIRSMYVDIVNDICRVLDTCHNMTSRHHKKHLEFSIQLMQIYSRQR